MNPDEMPVNQQDSDKNWPEFQSELASLLNRYGMGLPSNTQDEVLAEYLTQCLVAYNIAFENRRTFEIKTNIIQLR